MAIIEQTKEVFRKLIVLRAWQVISAHQRKEYLMNALKVSTVHTELQLLLHVPRELTQT